MADNEQKDTMIDVSNWTVDDWRQITGGLNEYNRRLLQIGVRIGSKARQEIIYHMKTSPSRDDPYLPFLYDMFSLTDEILQRVVDSFEPKENSERRNIR